MVPFGFGFLADEEYRKFNAMSSFFAASIMGRSTTPLPYGQFACGEHGLRSAPHNRHPQLLAYIRKPSLDPATQQTDKESRRCCT